MGLLQRAIETYDANARLVGVYPEGHEPLAPVGHLLTSAGIEITLNVQGELLAARKVEKNEPKILIPVTENSGGRSSTAAVAHPLCDQLKYVACTNEQAHECYLATLRAWMESAYGHPFLSAVYAYVVNGTILEDLEKSGALALNKKGKYDEKLLVCWRVLGINGEEPACWKNQNLFSLYENYYYSSVSDRDRRLCMVSGTEDLIVSKYQRGIISKPYTAKLISCNDNEGFTYRGRFLEGWQAATVGYIASQKAHNALRWLASEEGVREFSGNRVFLCWNPAGKTIPKPMRRIRSADAEPVRKPSEYRQQLRSTLLSFRQEHQLADTDRAVLVSFDAATTGRLAVTDYNELSLKTFLERMHDWDAHCCWYAGSYGIQAPNLLQIVDRAFGEARKRSPSQKGFLETDDRIQRQHLQRLLNCKINGGVFPLDILKALTQRASSPQAYEESVWKGIVQTACAALQKYRYDTKQGGNEMAWTLDQKDRSFQYGRLLAVLERAEEDYYYKTSEKESRQTNAMKFMSEFRRRPFSVFERINRHLQQAYIPRIEAWQVSRYNRLVEEIMGILREYPEGELNRPLDDLYLMGYELQRSAFFQKNNDSTNDDHIEEE